MKISVPHIALIISLLLTINLFGQTDKGGKKVNINAPIPQLSELYCGRTLNLMNQLIYSDVIPGAQDYEYRFTNDSLAVSSSIRRGQGTNDLSLNWMSGLLNGVTYNVQVRVKVNGEWQNYGKGCPLTTSPDATIIPDPPVIKDLPDTIARISADKIKQLENNGTLLNSASHINRDSISNPINNEYRKMDFESDSRFDPNNNTLVLSASNQTEFKTPNRSDIAINMDTRISNGEISPMLAYPSPISNNEVLTIDMQNVPIETTGVIHLSIYDVRGEVILSQQFAEAKLLHLSIDERFKRGFYFIEMYMDDRKYSKRIVVR